MRHCTNRVPAALICWATLLGGAELLAAPAEECLLRATTQVGDTAAVELLLEVQGQIFVREKSETKPHKLAVAGKMAYEERVLGLGDASLEGRRSLRHYERAQATIQIDEQRIAQDLPTDCQTIAVDRLVDQTVLSSPHTLLAREELDLLEVPGNSLLIESILPGHKLAVGQTWSVSDHSLSAVVGLDAVASSKVDCTLASIEGNKAKLELAGTLSGAVDGVSSEIDLKGKLVFDTQVGRLTWVALLVREKRSIGHVGPGLEITARLQMKLTPRPAPTFLGDKVVSELSGTPAEEMLQLQYTSSGGGYRFAYDRRFHVISDEPGVLVMRLVDRGDMIAQCNVSPVTPTADRATTIEQFNDQVARSLGKGYQETIDAAEGRTTAGLTLFRVVAKGEVEGLAVQWNYYLVTEPNGRQVVFSFTMEGEQAGRLGDLDNMMVSSIEFADTGEPTTASREADPRR